MSQWLQWIILSSITGSPLLSAVALIVFWWSVDRVTVRFLPNPLRWLRRWQRENALARLLRTNPHDRRARLELADLCIARKRYARAMELLRPNLEAGDDDASTLYAMGIACLGAGYADQGELLLSETEKSDPTFKLGQIDLERGRFRLARGDARGAREALERFLENRRGSVEGRVLLASALDALGDDGAAALMRREAWNEFVASPRFQRNIERAWAWRAKPSRPILYGVGLLLALTVMGATIRSIRAHQAAMRDAAGIEEP